MPRLLSTALLLRRDPRVLKAPPYIAFLCILIGFAWLLMLPLDEYSRRTYISENALLPGQVHTYFGGSEENVLRAYREEVDTLRDADNYRINNHVEGMLKNIGLKVGRQNYTYHSAGDVVSGENVYGILQAPRGDATEAIVLVASWENTAGVVNRNGVALALTLARYFKRWSLWSKDIILVIPPDSKSGTQAWVDAYHDAHDPNKVSPLPIKSGALQGALAIDYPFDNKFESLHIIYDGTNGQLPNLDLINSIVNIAGGQMGIDTGIQDLEKHSNNYQDRLQTILRGMLRQGLGYSTGPHSCFIPYHVDAVTLQPRGNGWHDEMAMGRVIEGTFRSLNNLLEHLHQSFFFYLLMHRDRFVSIGTYLPSAMLLAANFSIMAIFLWVKSGQPPSDSKGTASKSKPNIHGAPVSLSALERDLFLPCAVVVLCHGLSTIPLYLFTNLPAKTLAPTFTVFTVASAALPVVASFVLSWYKPTVQQYQLIKSFSLLFLGMSLATLATLNFSLAFLVGIVCSPLSFVQSNTNSFVRWTLAGILSIVSPATLLQVICQVAGVSAESILTEASFGWDVWGMYTPVVVWCVWWPAWLIGMINVLGTAEI